MRCIASQRKLLVAATVPFLGLLFGCSQPDNPAMVEAPTFTPEPNPEPPKLPGRKEPYGASKKYQEAMERQHNR
jgi:hypothetical protein